MPKYDYECSKCGVMELEKKMSDKEITICPKCSRPIARTWTYAPPDKFNGTGFYETDYKGK